jgi:hypothetical protein
MFEYKKPIAEIINLQPADKMMGKWDDDESGWGDDEDWPEED